MSFPYLTRGRAPAPAARAADFAVVVTALIALLALVAIPLHLAGTDPAPPEPPRIEDWRGNSASLPLRP